MNPTHFILRASRGLAAAAVAVLAGWNGGAALTAADQTPQQQIDMLYGNDLKKVKTTTATADDLALAQKFVEDGIGAKQNKPFQAALLRRACALALEDATNAGPAAAEKAMAGMIAADIIPAAAGWQELADKAPPILRRRNLGRQDPLLSPYLDWLRKQAEAALAAGEQSAAERALNALIREAQYQKCKYEADEAAQLLARCRFEAPFRAAARRDWTKWQEQPTDAALAQKAGEAALAQLGDWAAAAEALASLKEGDWPFILQARKKRLAPPVADEPQPENAPLPTPQPTAVQLLHAADTLAAMAEPRSTSVVGRAALLSEAAALATAAEQADSAGLSTQQKIELAATIKQIQTAAAKAQNEFETAFARAARINWTYLISANRAADWEEVGESTTWLVLANDVLQGKGEWDSIIRSRRVPKMGDFVLECEYQRKSPEVHPFFLLREHTWTPCYAVQIAEEHADLIFEQGGDNGERVVAKSKTLSPQNRWMKLRLVWEGERYRVWLNDELVMDGLDRSELTPGGICLGAAKGTVWYRNLRVRELK